MITKTENNFEQLKFNVLTKEMYDTLAATGEVSENEIYVIDEEVDHNTLKNRNAGFQHTASTIVFDDLVSLEQKLEDNTLCEAPLQTLGSSQTRSMSQKAISDEIAEIYSTTAPLQTTGTSETKSMSQSAISTELARIYAALISLGWQE